jgi:hypothetical protein
MVKWFFLQIPYECFAFLCPDLSSFIWCMEIRKIQTLVLIWVIVINPTVGKTGYMHEVLACLLCIHGGLVDFEVI